MHSFPAMLAKMYKSIIITFYFKINSYIFKFKINRMTQSVLKTVIKRGPDNLAHVNTGTIKGIYHGLSTCSEHSHIWMILSVGYGLRRC